MDYGDIRHGLYDYLVAEIAEVGGRVFWEWTAPADTEKPLIEIAFLGEIPSPNKCAMNQQLEVLVFGEKSNILALDPVADHVVSALHHQAVATPDGRTTLPEYVRDSRMDIWSERLNACGIRIKFLIPTDFWA